MGASESPRRSDLQGAPFVSLNAYAGTDLVECSCFAALPAANISSTLCGSNCPDIGVEITCGDYDCETPQHPVSLFARDGLADALACEVVCRYALPPR